MNYFRTLQRARRLRERHARRVNAELHAADSLYLRDFHGQLFLFFDGRPVLPAADIKGDAIATLGRARHHLANYYCKER